MKRELVLGLGVAAAIAALAPAGAQAAADITCQVNAHGVQVEPEANFVVGKTFGHGIGVADAECVSLTEATYSLPMTVTVEALVNGSWVSAGCSTNRSGTVTAGVGVVSPTSISCVYPSAFGVYERIKATLTNSVDGVARTAYSNTWWESGR